MSWENGGWTNRAAAGNAPRRFPASSKARRALGVPGACQSGLQSSQSLEAPLTREPDRVRIVDAAGVDSLVLEPCVEVLEERHANAAAVQQVLIARARVEARTVVEIDLRVDVVEVVTDLAEQLDRAQRNRAVDGRCEAAQVGAEVAAGAARCRCPLARTTEVDVCQIQCEVRIHAPADERFPRRVAVVEPLDGLVRLIDVVDLHVELTDAAADVEA